MTPSPTLELPGLEILLFWTPDKKYMVFCQFSVDVAGHLTQSLAYWVSVPVLLHLLYHSSAPVNTVMTIADIEYSLERPGSDRAIPGCYVPAQPPDAS